MWVQTPNAAIWTLQHHPIITLSLDHDLGIDLETGEDLTTRPVVLWLCEQPAEKWPTIVRAHSANPVGRSWLEGMIERYKP